MGRAITLLAREIFMQSDTMTEVGVDVEFGSENFIANAAMYAEHRRMIDAASKYDSLDDAQAALVMVWEKLDEQCQIGGGYTPDRAAGFGSDNGSQIAAAILGRKTSVTATRKAFAVVGKAVINAGK